MHRCHGASRQRLESFDMQCHGKGVQDISLVAQFRGPGLMPCWLLALLGPGSVRAAVVAQGFPAAAVGERCRGGAFIASGSAAPTSGANQGAFSELSHQAGQGLGNALAQPGLGCLWRLEGKGSSLVCGV